MVKRVVTPLNDLEISELKCGDSILLTGIIYTARDAAHKRLIELIEKGEELPFDLEGETIYYVGPTPPKPGMVIGSAGPTTSYRMDAYAPKLLDLGLKGMIGKGLRNEEVIESIKRNKAIYFGAIGGAAALIGKSIVKSEVIAYEDLGSDLPLVVIIDSLGNNLYEIGKENYLKTV